MDIASHKNRLLANGRCAHCAERVPRSAIVRADRCPCCERPLSWSGGDILSELEERQTHWRLLGYLMVAAASFVAGAVPLLQVVVQVAALFILHVIVLRRGLLWLPPGRRVMARIAIKMFGAVLATVALLINVAIVPFVGVSAFVLGLVGPALTALYVEGGLYILRQRLAWEREGRGLRFVEWGLPLFFFIGLAAAVGGTIAIVMGGLHMVATADLPTVSELAKTFLEMGQ